MEYNPNNRQYASALCIQMTPWERKLWFCFLQKYPIRFQRQKCIGHYIVDFYCFRAKLVVELDGGGHYDSEFQRKDAIRTKKMESYGLKVIRFCNTDIDKNFDVVCTVIDREVKQRI